MGVDRLIAIVMAGGKATRFGRGVEKATLEVGGTTLLERSLRSLAVDGVSEALVAVSPATQRTKGLADAIGAETVMTMGRGYHEDVTGLLEVHGTFVSVNVDVPFVTREHVLRMVDAYEGTSVAAVVPSSISLSPPRAESTGIGAAGGEYVWVGLNIVTPDPETALLEYADPLLSVNINDEEDLRFAESIARKRGV